MLNGGEVKISTKSVYSLNKKIENFLSEKNTYVYHRIFSV